MYYLLVMYYDCLQELFTKIKYGEQQSDFMNANVVWGFGPGAMANLLVHGLGKEVPVIVICRDKNDDDQYWLYLEGAHMLVYLVWCA